jgi:hypothetical protein
MDGIIDNKFVGGFKLCTNAVELFHNGGTGSLLIQKRAGLEPVLIGKHKVGGVFAIANKLSEVAVSTRGVKFIQKDSGSAIAEFAEATVTAVTKAAAGRK